MKIREVLEKNKTSFSFEFFPPKTEAGNKKLIKTIHRLMPLTPSSVSVTYGAGGSTRERTHDLIAAIRRETAIPVVSHLTCIHSREAEIHSILQRYSREGVDNILALRGDPPIDSHWNRAEDHFQYAVDLVKYIRKEFPQMGIGVAGFPEGHPETPNRIREIEFLKEKIDAGADYIVTQLFFENRDFYDYCERCAIAGINVPIVAGIMPIQSRKNMMRMAELAAGTRFPAALQKAVMRAASDHLVEKVGIHWATEQIRDLIDNEVKGIHLYTLNDPAASLEIYENLGIFDTEGM